MAINNPAKEIHNIPEMSPAELIWTKKVRPVEFAAPSKEFDMEFRTFVVKFIASSMMGCLMGDMVLICCLRLDIVQTLVRS